MIGAPLHLYSCSNFHVYTANVVDFYFEVSGNYFSPTKQESIASSKPTNSLFRETRFDHHHCIYYYHHSEVNNYSLFTLLSVLFCLLLILIVNERNKDIHGSK